MKKCLNTYFLLGFENQMVTLYTYRNSLNKTIFSRNKIEILEL